MIALRGHVFLFFVILLAGCVNNQDFEEFFHEKMREMHSGEENYSYTLLHTEYDAVHEDDAIAIFKEMKHQREAIFIAYYEKIDNEWRWRHTRGADWNSPVNWSVFNQAPYLYSGTLSGAAVEEILVDDKKAKVIKVEGDKRFWYAISDRKGAVVSYKTTDGTKVIEEFNMEKAEENSKE